MLFLKSLAIINLVPMARLFPNLQSQGKAPWGRGCGDYANLIGSQECDLFTKHILAPNHKCSK